MDYDGVNSIVCDAEESDWLDVSYSERNYVDKPKRERKKINFKKINKPIKIIAVAVLCLAILATLLLIDNQFAKDVFETAKAAFASTVFAERQQEPVNASVSIPSNVDLVDVADGVATFGGGKATVSFTAGKVTEATETSVTVAIDDSTSIVYGNLTNVFVSVGDDVAVNTLLGKYDGSFTAQICIAGETVVDVVGSESQLTWNV